MRRGLFVTLLAIVTALPSVLCEGNVLVHIHNFAIPRGCPDYSTSSVGRYSDRCQVYLRVCLQPNSKTSVALCPMSSYTTDTYHNVGGGTTLQLSTHQPAKLSFTGPAQGYSILVEAWGHDEVSVNKTHILGTFVAPIGGSLGEWSQNKELTQQIPHRAIMTLQWQVLCSAGFLPIGTCARSCQRTDCVLCLDTGEKECRPSCSREECVAQGMEAALLPVWQAWQQWSGCSARCGVGFQTRSRRCSNDLDARQEGVVPRRCVGDVEMIRECRGSNCSGVEYLCGAEGCQNGGLCQPVASTAEVSVIARLQLSYECMCTDDYVGPHCESLLQHSTLSQDDNLAVNIAVFLSVGIVALVLVAVMCCCYRRCRTKTHFSPVKHDDELGMESPSSTIDSFKSKSSSRSVTSSSDASDSKKGGRFKNVKRPFSIVHPHFEPRQSWSRRSSKLASQEKREEVASSTSVNSDSFRTPTPTVADNLRLKAIVETAESGAALSSSSVTSASSPDLPIPRRKAPRRPTRQTPSPSSDESIYQPPSASTFPALDTTTTNSGGQYEEIGDVDVYEDVAVTEDGGNTFVSRSMSGVGAGGGSAAGRNTPSGSNTASMRRAGLAARLGQCVGAGAMREDRPLQPSSHNPMPFSETAVFGVLDATSPAESGGSRITTPPLSAAGVQRSRLPNDYEEAYDRNLPSKQQHHQDGSTPTSSLPRAMMTWWSKRSNASSPQPWGFLRLGRSSPSGMSERDRSAGADSPNPSSGSERMAHNPLYGQ